MSRTYLLALFLSLGLLASAQSVTLPYNPDVDQDSAIGAGDLLGLLPLFGNYFTPSEVLVDGETLTDYIAALEAAAANATSDTVTLPMLPGTAPGEMLYWDGVQWSLVPTGLSGQALLLDGTTPTWKELKTGCTDSVFLEFDPAATVNDGSCLTPIVLGCTDALFVEFDPGANVDDGTCATLDTSCSSVEFDGYVYTAVEIGDQCWFAENLRTMVYANGDVIPAGLTDGEWTTTTFGATAVYGEGSSDCYNLSPDVDACDEVQSLAEYGRLYNWYAVADARGLCPNGWHVPTDGEWTELEDYITSQGFSGTEGTTLKSTTGWAAYYEVDGNGTDDFGYTALPGGYRFDVNGLFNDTGKYGYWWSSSPSGSLAWLRTLKYGNSGIFQASNNRRDGMSVRCLKDAEIPEVQGCTDPAYIEYDSTATADDGSCLTLVVLGCTDAAYAEYNAAANMDDGSCATLTSTCTDVEMNGHIYAVVEIGGQCWFAENLRTTLYTNGDTIPAGLTDGEWTSTTAGATAVYGEGGSDCQNYSPDIDACNEAQSLAAYGGLYNWYAVDDARGLCPTGWHVPTDGEWTELEDFIISQGFAGTEGTALKSTTGWASIGNGTNDFGFSALPGGSRGPSNGFFGSAGLYGYWWSLSPVGGDAWYRSLRYNDLGIIRGEDVQRFGFSVRCLRDAE